MRRVLLGACSTLLLVLDCAAPPPATPCPVTVPNGSTPPGEPRSANNHGNGELWTIVPSGGRVFTGTETHVATEKFPWWRGPGVVGKLTITGRRLDGPAPPLQADIPDGYGQTGFQSTRLVFPSEGCWEVTGRVGDATLTFVLRAA